MTISFHVPVDGKLLVKAGEQVDFKTPLVKKHIELVTKVHLSKILKIPNDKIFLYLSRVAGDEVKKGETIAEKKNFFEKKEYKSELSGVIREVNHHDGSILIAQSSSSEEQVLSYFTGRVEGVSETEIKLKVAQAKSFPLKSSDLCFGGKTSYFSKQTLGTIEEKSISDRVLVAESITPHDESKLEVMGALGYVVLKPEEAGAFPTPYACIKTQADWEEINRLEFPYCLVDKERDTIFFYRAYEPK